MKRLLVLRVTPLLLSCFACSESGDDGTAGAAGSAALAALAELCQEGDPPPDYCLPGCQIVGDTHPPPVQCVAGHWECPEGSMPFAQCPGACLVHYWGCCDRATGEAFLPTCSPNGYGERCPDHTEYVVRGSTGTCPVGESACALEPDELDGQPCEEGDSYCTYGPNWTCDETTCFCRADESGAYRYACEPADC